MFIYYCRTYYNVCVFITCPIVFGRHGYRFGQTEADFGLVYHNDKQINANIWITFNRDREKIRLLRLVKATRGVPMVGKVKNSFFGLVQQKNIALARGLSRVRGARF